MILREFWVIRNNNLSDFRLPGEFRVVLRSKNTVRVKFNIPMLYGTDIAEGRGVFWEKRVQDLEFFDNTNFTKWYSLNEEVKAGKAFLEDETRTPEIVEVLI